MVIHTINPSAKETGEQIYLWDQDQPGWQSEQGL